MPARRRVGGSCARCGPSQPCECPPSRARARTRPPVTSVISVTSGEVTQVTGNNSREGDPLDGLRGGAWLSAQTFPPLRYAIPGLIPEGFTILAGPPKAGKSRLVLDWLLATAAGGRAIGSIPVGPARPVFYLALEDSDRRMQDRCRILLGEGAQIPDQFWYKTRADYMTVIPVLRAFLERNPDTGLIVVDTIGRVTPPAASGETTYQRDYRLGSSLQLATVRYPGLSLVACHHTRKADSDDFAEKLSGTLGLAGAADTVMVLTRSRFSSEGLLKVTGRDIAEEQYALTVNEGIWRLTGADLGQAAAAARELAEAQQLGELSRQILAWFRAQPNHSGHFKDVVAKFGSSARVYLSRLTDAGRLERLTKGLYALPPEGE